MSRSLVKELAAFFALGLLPRVWAVTRARDVALYLDELDYFKRASFLMETGHLPDAFRPPVYPLFLAAVRTVWDAVAAVRLSQAVVGAVIAVVLVAWLRPLVGSRGARLAGALAALYPTFVGIPHQVLSETLCLALFSLALALTLSPGSPRPTRALVAGVAFGLAWLTRSAMMSALPVLLGASMVQVGAWRWRSKPALRGLLFAAGVALVVTPWAAHNKVVQGEWILVEMTSGYNLWKGNTPTDHAYRATGPVIPGPLIPVPMFAYEGSAEKLAETCAARTGQDFSGGYSSALDDCARDLAVAYIRADPLAFLARGPEKLLLAFHPSSGLTRSLWLGWYGDVSRTAGMALIQVTAWSYGLVMLLGIVGFVRARWTPLKTALALLVAGQLLVIFVSFGSVRFRVVVELLMMVLAAFCLAPGGRVLDGASPASSAGAAGGAPPGDGPEPRLR